MAILANINQLLACLLTVAGFNTNVRANIMKGKMIGRFHLILANDLYTAFNPTINTEPTFLAWLVPFAEALPYLYEHMSQYIEIRLKQANP
ncbi:7401_t:CDS:2, partial [Funneliformis geosporum]